MRSLKGNKRIGLRIEFMFNIYKVKCKIKNKKDSVRTRVCYRSQGSWVSFVSNAERSRKERKVKREPGCRAWRDKWSWGQRENKGSLPFGESSIRGNVLDWQGCHANTGKTLPRSAAFKWLGWSFRTPKPVLFPVYYTERQPGKGAH